MLSVVFNIGLQLVQHIYGYNIRNNVKNISTIMQL